MKFFVQLWALAVCFLLSNNYSFAFKITHFNQTETSEFPNAFVPLEEEHYYIENVQSGLVIGAVINEGEHPLPATMEEKVENSKSLTWRITAGTAIYSFYNNGPNEDNKLSYGVLCMYGVCNKYAEIYNLIPRITGHFSIRHKQPFDWGIGQKCLTADGLHNTVRAADCDVQDQSQSWKLVKVE